MTWLSSAGELPKRVPLIHAGWVSRSVIVALSVAIFVSALPTGSAHVADEAVIDDKFSRTTAGSWGTAAVGGSYTLTGPSSSFSVNGSRGLIALSSNGRLHAAALPVSVRDANIALKVGVDRLPKAGYFHVAVLARASAGSHYRLVMRISPTGAVSLRIVRLLSGRKLVLGSPVTLSGLRVDAGKQYQIRFRATGTGPTVLEAKVWPASTSQPTNWAIRRTDSASTLQKAGTLAVRVSASRWAPFVPARFQFDDFIVRNLLTMSSNPPPSSPPVSSDGYLLMPRSELLSLPTSGTAWSALKTMADGSWGSPDLCDQNRKHGAMALAGALVYARTGTSSYYTKVRNAIMSAIGTQQVGCGNAILSLGRQLGSYVLAADFIKLSGSDDSTFRSWLDKIRTRDLGGHGRWSVLSATHADANNNWGAFAGASRIAASLYLGDTTDVATAAKIVRGFFGDRTAWSKFRSPLYSDEAVWNCSGSSTSYTPVDPTCTKSGINLDGAIVGDIYRDGNGLTWPVGPVGTSYTLESLQGLVLQTELLYRNGYSGAWGWSDSALKRAAGLITRNGKAGGTSWNYSSVSYYVTWMLNFRYDLGLPTKAAGYGRMFGYTDWLYGGR